MELFDYECYNNTMKNNSNKCICPDNCHKCFYGPDSYYGAECTECFPGYYLKKDKLNNNKCIECPNNCYNCSLINNEIKCNNCSPGFFLSGNNCISCGDNCNSCNENHICNNCMKDYHLSNGECLKCSEHCSKCIKENDNIKCIICDEFFTLNLQNECENCPSNCNDCFFKDNKFICTKCKENYILINDKCDICSNDESIGGIGCLKCEYSNNTNKCKECKSNDYALIINKYQCLSNLNPNIENLNGCLKANYINGNYECIYCKSGFILILNEKKCKNASEIKLNNYCENATKINVYNNLYSCSNCQSYNNICKVFKKIDGIEIMNCSIQEGNLVNCLKATEDNNENVQCNQCVSNFQLIWSNQYMQKICDNKCSLGMFLKNNFCYKCDNQINGNQGCNSAFGCDYNLSNNLLNCYGCKSGYFLNLSQCLSCKVYNNKCSECHLDLNKNKFKCDKCEDEYYLNNQTDNCEIITYEEYPEITEGCMLSNNNASLYKSKNKCLFCKKGFFKTKEESCIYCNSKKNGGPSCEECEYLKDINGNDLNEIKCKICPIGNILTSEIHML